MRLFKRERQSKMSVSEVDKLLKEYSDIKHNIEFLENEHLACIKNSLENEFDKYRVNLNSGIIHKSIYWYVTESSFGEIQLLKNSDRGNISIDVKHSTPLDKNVEIKSITITRPSYINVKDISYFKEIVLKYLMEHHINKIKNRFEDTKQSFSKIENIIGKDITRDYKIDKIMNDD